jgi:hypothetical protein
MRVCIEVFENLVEGAKHMNVNRNRRAGQTRQFDGTWLSADKRSSVLSWPLFIGLYLFFVLNTIVTTAVMKWTLVTAYPKFAITLTAQLYQLMQKNTNSVAQVLTNSTHTWSQENLQTYLSISLHNSLLVLIGAGLFAMVFYLPQVHNRILYHAIEYLRIICVLFFFSFGPIILAVNALLIPFILASVSYAVAIPSYVLGVTTLVHGLVEYASLALLIMVTVQTWRLTWWERTTIPDANQRDLQGGRFARLPLRLVQAWYRSLFSKHSIGNRFRLALTSLQMSVFKIYGLAILIFFAAGIIEIYISPSVGTQLLAHS